MQNRLNQIRNRLQKNKSLSLIEGAELFMHEYGMSFKEFLELPIPTYFALLDVLNKSKRVGWESMLIQFMKSFSKRRGRKKR